ncbi:hypothetical protein J4N45_11065 [Vibrio sp. SCSIO 43140]|uniref:hypothetical protein n=1 Tax=Vibrio sp. SCSIO 43140 TaxID=2819100 RepID=UPI00207638BB|nr:hypothetical protein [Vibrio sp. SCSIO 43140]USD59071.1 hypothetical protein J4N45_11065 [Vibrio sp. SCSIO 43140]
MENKFSNNAVEIIAAKEPLDKKFLELVYRAAVKVDSDIERLDSMTNGSGFKGVDPASSVYRSAIDTLQMFNDLVNDSEPLKALFDDMWEAVYQFKSKV